MRLIRKILKAVGILVLSLILLVISLVIYLGIVHNQSLDLPAPTGPYQVGRTEYDWVDPNRLDPLSEKPGTKRELLVWVWYPANGSQPGTPAPYLPAAWVKARDDDQGLGRFIEHDFRSIKTHSIQNADLANVQDGFPVIIMQPGMGPVPTDYTVFAENLASYGYVVFGINQTHTSNLVVFPDGRIVLRSEQGTIPDSAGPAAADQDANRIEAVWAADVLFVMDQLQNLQMDPSSRFHGKLDLAHIGIFGHSFGGATAVRICQRDMRCKAGADLDGTVFSEDVKGTIQEPFLFMAEDACGKDCATMHQMYLSANQTAYYLSIKGTKHFDFSDLPLRLSPPGRSLFRWLGIIGSIQPKRGLEISNAYLVDFFNQELKGIHSILLQGASSAFPEVRLQSH